MGEILQSTSLTLRETFQFTEFELLTSIEDFKPDERIRALAVLVQMTRLAFEMPHVVVHVGGKRFLVRENGHDSVLATEYTGPATKNFKQNLLDSYESNPDLCRQLFSAILDKLGPRLELLSKDDYLPDFFEFGIDIKQLMELAKTNIYQSEFNTIAVSLIKQHLDHESGKDFDLYQGLGLLLSSLILALLAAKVRETNQIFTAISSVLAILALLELFRSHIMEAQRNLIEVAREYVVGHDSSL